MRTKRNKGTDACLGVKAMFPCLICKQTTAKIPHLGAMLLLIPFLMFLPLRVIADIDKPAGWFERSEEGWFWYNEELPLEEDDQEDKEEAAVAGSVEVPEEPTSVPEPGPRPFSVAWLKIRLPEYRDRAVDNPTPANIAAYMYLQRVALDKASRYAAVAQRVVLQDPYLDETVRRPTATFGVHALGAQANFNAVEMVKNIAQRAGIVFFFRSDCPYCHKQAPVLAMLERLYGFRVLPVSLDGRPMPGGLYTQFKVDTGQAARLGVMVTPSLFLMAPPDQFIPIGQGLMSADEIKNRMLMMAADRGWITEQQFATTRPVIPGPSLDRMPDDVSEEDLSDPDRLVEYLRANSRFAPGR